jgi:predicted AAA+ superfamily ATPase
MTDFTPQLHPQHKAILRGEIAPPKTGEDAVTFNDRLGLWITRHVGTM